MCVGFADKEGRFVELPADWVQGLTDASLNLDVNATLISQHRQLSLDSACQKCALQLQQAEIAWQLSREALKVAQSPDEVSEAEIAIAAAEAVKLKAAEHSQTALLQSMQFLVSLAPLLPELTLKMEQNFETIKDQHLMQPPCKHPVRPNSNMLCHVYCALNLRCWSSIPHQVSIYWSDTPVASKGLT